MNLRRLSIYIFWVLCLSQTILFAQYSQYPAHQSQTFLLVPSYNPALQNQEGYTVFLLNYQRYMAAFDKVNNKLFTVNINLNNQDSARVRHNVGLKFSNEDEGEYISRYRFYASYGFHMNVYKDYWLGTGIYLGAAGYQYKGGSAFTQGSDLGPDGDVGFVFYRPRNFSLAVATNQIFNTIIRPKDLAFRWTRYYHLYARKDFNLNHQWILSGYLQHIFRRDTYHTTDIGGLMTYQEKFMGGMNVTRATKLSFFLGFQNISLKSNSFSLLVNYSFPFGNKINTNIQALEMTLGYKLSR